MFNISSWESVFSLPLGLIDTKSSIPSAMSMNHVQVYKELYIQQLIIYGDVYTTGWLAKLAAT